MLLDQIATWRHIREKGLPKYQRNRTRQATLLAAYLHTHATWEELDQALGYNIGVRRLIQAFNHILKTDHILTQQLLREVQSLLPKPVRTLRAQPLARRRNDPRQSLWSRYGDVDPIQVANRHAIQSWLQRATGLRSKPRRALARQLAALMLRRFTNCSYAEIAETVGYAHVPAVARGVDLGLKKIPHDVDTQLDERHLLGLMIGLPLRTDEQL